MSKANTKAKKAFFDKVHSELDKQFSKKEAERIKQFVDAYFANVLIDEFESRPFVDVFGFIVSTWHFVQKSSSGQAKVSVFNPTFENNGWNSPRTLVAVMHDNMPFMVDSIRIELANRKSKIHGIYHSVIASQRGSKGELLSVDGSQDQTLNELGFRKGDAIIFVEIDRISNRKDLKELEAALVDMLDDVHIAVADYPNMKAQTLSLLEELDKTAQHVASAKEIDEAKEFIQWIANDRFTFLGYVEYKHKKDGSKRVLDRVAGSSLGIMKKQYKDLKRIDLDEMSKKSKAHITSKDLFLFAKSSRRSRIHRPAYPDYIVLKTFDAKGEVIGEKRILGLYTAKVYNEHPSSIPLLRKKAEGALRKSGLDQGDYSGKELNQIIATYPRDELFQMNTNELHDVAMGIFYIQERRQIRLFMREDAFGRFVTAIVYLPRDLYDTRLRIKIQNLLMGKLDGIGVDFSTTFWESTLTRTVFTIRVTPHEDRKLNASDLEDEIKQCAYSWQEEFEETLKQRLGESKAEYFIDRYLDGLSAAYKEDFSAGQAVLDLERIDHVNNTGMVQLGLYRTLDEDENTFNLKLFKSDDPFSLSEVMPTFEHLGFRVGSERPHDIVDSEGNTVWVQDFRLSADAAVDLDEVKEELKELMTQVWQGQAEDDAFNKLLVSVGLGWRDISILRSISRYLKQIRSGNSQEFIACTLDSHPSITRLLLDVFEAKFKPGKTSMTKRQDAIESLRVQFDEALEQVANLNEDKVLRLFFDVLSAIVRTNYYQLDESGKPKNYIAFKIQPERIPNIPQPVPAFEIFVCSPKVEGVHLRGGKVARGGLRWSDRHEDFRTEVLGLVKAQQVKNAVIVPVGAKGGFIAKGTEGLSREEFMAAGVAAYRTFITALLDVTDNLVENKVVPPAKVVRHDEDDYYLVVAADKGTATFSDIANEISVDKGHWLGDAFASGGSQGYDHKKMGITAKGAWVSVERHFREIGINTRTDEFTAVGVGDMSGDVFGNGMLLSEHTQLLAAFNHLHIFIDPTPKASASFKERQRMFELPRSTWDDYDKKLISKGGGVFSRADKRISITPQMKKAFGIVENQLTPNELISAILKSQVDLLWFGGIGTYVKSAQENHADVGDKANDGLRINGGELGARIVGEGGNLGMTQLGRIEYGMKGGRLNTDFIDNAGGVDCSDHEVNIKIMLDELVKEEALSVKQRNKLLEKMTDEVSDLVLHNNYRQTGAISVAFHESHPRLEEYRRLINSMEDSGLLDRELEFVPSDEELAERKASGKGMTRPELSVLISYVKGELKEQLAESDLSDQTHMNSEIMQVFPGQLTRRYQDKLFNHRLRREIISTQIANDMVNHMGITFVSRLRQSTGANVGDIALAYIIARNVFDLEHWWCEIEKLDYQVSSDVQLKMMSELMSLIRRACRWLIRNRRSEINIVSNIDKFSKGISQITQKLPSYLEGIGLEFWQTNFDALTEQGVPKELAMTVAGARQIYASLGIIEAQEETGETLDKVASVYYKLGSRLDLNWFGQQINGLKPVSHWQALARETFREDLDWQQRSLTSGILRLKDAPSAIDKRIDKWMSRHTDLIDRWQLMLKEFKSTSGAEYSMYSVALRELLDLAQSTEHIDLTL